MMEWKGKHNSFVLYTDYSQHIALLSDAEAGQLFKGLFEFMETGELLDLSGSLAMTMDLYVMYAGNKSRGDGKDSKSVLI